MEVTIIGGGFVGTTTAISLAEQDHTVRLVEMNPARRTVLAQGRLPFFESDAEPAFAAQVEAGRIRIVEDALANAPGDVVLLCVGTPQDADGHADLSQVASAARQVAQNLLATDGYTVVSIKSTVPPGTTRRYLLQVLEEHHVPLQRYDVAMTPEFLREGSALADARAPDRIVLGALSNQAHESLEQLFAGFDCPKIRTNLETAEAIKYAANAFLATKIAFANEIANLAEHIGVNVDEVMDGAGADNRIGRAFLNAGCGFGGSCFPKDLAALRALAGDHGERLTILDAVLANNETQALRPVELLRARLGSLEGTRIALLGLAFKPGTSDVRETRALPIWQALNEAGAEVVCHDPHGAEEFLQLTDGKATLAELADALQGADGCIVQTEWPEYKQLTAADFLAAMRQPIVVDARRHLDRVALCAAGVDIISLGIGGVPLEAPVTVQEVTQ